MFFLLIPSFSFAEETDLQISREWSCKGKFTPIGFDKLANNDRLFLEDNSHPKQKKVEQPAKKELKPKDFNFWNRDFSGDIVFDYFQNNGSFAIGDAEYLFNLNFSPRSDDSIYMYADLNIGEAIAVAFNAVVPEHIMDFDNYDFSERVRAPNIGQLIIIKNPKGKFAVIKIKNIHNKTNTVEFCFRIIEK